MDKKRTLILLHIPVWVVAISIAWFFSADDFPGSRPSYVLLATLVSSVWMLGSFYAFYSYLVPKLLMKDDRRRFWLYSLLLVVIIIPVILLFLMLLTGNSALTLSESFSAKGLSPYFGSVVFTSICGLAGALCRLLLKRYHRV